MNPPERKPDALLRPLLWMLAILCAAYLPLFLGRIFFFRDIAHWAFPARAFLRDSLARGELPAWNPYQGLGFPIFGDPLYGVFYPPNWLFLLVGPGWVASMLNWQYFLHLAWGAAGVCWLSRRIGVSSKGTLVAGLAWGLSGYTTAQWTSGLLILADAWVPWAAVGQVALWDSLRSGGPAWYKGLVKAVLPVLFAVLLGEVFLAMIGAAFGVAFAATLHAVEQSADPSLPRLRPSWLLRAALAIMLAFGAGSVVIVPAKVLLGSTERSAPLSVEVAQRCSLHPLRLLEFVAPHCLGNAYGEYPAASIVGEKKLDGLPLSYSMYLGASVVAMALAAFGRKRRMALAIAGFALAALVLALGKYTPVYDVFRRVVFPLAYMRYPEKYMVIVVAAVSLLAGLGCERVLSIEPQPWRRSALLLVALLVSAVVAYATLPALWLGFAVHAVMLAGLALLGMLATHFLASRASSLAPLMLVAVVAFDLAAAAWPLQGFGGRRISSEPPPAARLALQLRSERLVPPRIYRSNLVTGSVNRWVTADSNTEGESRLVQTLITNTVNAWGIATLPGYDAAIPALVERVWDAGLGVGQSALRLLGADFAILPVTTPGLRENDRPGLDPIAEPLPGARMYRVPGALPRVFLARHAEVLPDEQALARLYEPAVVAGASAWLAPDQGARPLPGKPGRGGDCSLESYENSRLVAQCITREPSLAVFVEQFARGWQASIDGHPARLLRANLIMRALPVDPGSHRIVLEYHTPGLPLGATISGLCLLVLCGFWLLGRPSGARVRSVRSSDSPAA